MSEDFELNRFSGLAKGIFGTRWHFLGWHVQNFTPFIRSVYSACIDLKAIDEDAPLRMLREIKNIGGRKNFEPHYDQLMQKLAEILVMRQVVNMPWPRETTFEIEAGVRGRLKRVDLVVSLPDGEKFGFEIKAPKYTAPARQRSEGKFQGVPPLEFQTKNADHAGLPRENSLRSFLRSANEKFDAFAARYDFCGILVIVWDDWIYEGIGPLLNERSGLLTPATYSVVNGAPEVFKNIDTVLILRHLTYFAAAASEGNLPVGEFDAMRIGDSKGNPNIIKEMSSIELPDFVKNGFNALPIDHPAIEDIPEYHANEAVYPVSG